MLENARITGLVAAVALSGMVMAQENRPGAGRDSLFSILDKNGDGTLGQGELDLAISSLRKLDRNQDGTISQEELRADQGSGGSPRPGGSPRSGGRGIAAPTWSEIDQDGDGKVSLKEAPERMKGRFDRMDQNGDGFLDKEEQERIDQMFRRMRGGGGQSPEGRGRGRSPRGGGSGSEDVWKILAEKYDKDRNGEISKEEYTRGGEKFTQLDRNEDGKLNEADFLGGRNRGGGRGGRGRGPGRDGGAGERSGIPEEGADAPDFELAYASKDGTAKNGRKVKLSSFKGDKPVALVFGSYTWPPFRREAGRLTELYNNYHKEVQFFLVYIKEAHALDSRSPSSFKGIEDPITLEERNNVCVAAIEDLKLPLPAIVDDMKDTANRAYSAQPDRLYLISKDGTIAFGGGKGPGGFKPDELEDAIKKELAK